MSEPPKPASEPKVEAVPRASGDGSKPEKDSFIAKAPIRRLMRSEGAYLVAEEAVEYLVEYLSKHGGDITKKALEHAEKDGRKKVTGGDIYAVAKPKTY